MSRGQRGAIVFATHNAGKLAEARALLAAVGFADVRSLADFPALAAVAETEATFEGNARAKALAAAAGTGLAAVGDDSGLCVDALDGAPGVRSARFAADAGRGVGDAANVRLLLERLRDVPAARRGARFICALAYCPAPGAAVAEEIVVRGTCEGAIGAAPAGEGGFGYDPVFVLPELGVTMAQLLPEEKNLLSHRARALAALIARLAGRSMDSAG
ncbi:MAG TPA: RdgB/HAM1 family non-canonical purine NTP pyrophosphatase [Myxococcota bacterium]|nr:RdgB/HAM1 family non-canonical purine NTP pyrophosphatase [Myxococcota bacterium]